MEKKCPQLLNESTEGRGQERESKNKREREREEDKIQFSTE